jgi:hypothetical protein
VDYRQAKLQDPSWWRRLGLLFQGMQQRANRTMIDAAYRFQLALVSNSQLTDDSFQKAQTRSVELFHDMIGALRPWEGASYVERKQQEFQDYRQMYIDAFDVDPSDPEFQAWEAQRIAEVNAGEFDVEEEDEEARVTRKLRERMTTNG